jgi:hypothetical protein
MLASLPAIRIKNWPMIFRILLFPPALGVLVFSAAAADLKVGMIGLDTSHSVEFTRILNDASDKEHVPGAQVVVAFKGGSPDIPTSWNRVDGFTKTLQEKYGVKMVGSVDEVVREADVVMIESSDGRTHLAEVLPVIQARKPLFVDKPVAASLRDALEIFRLARENNVPIYSGSSLRFYPNLQEMKGPPTLAGSRAHFRMDPPDWNRIIRIYIGTEFIPPRPSIPSWDPAAKAWPAPPPATCIWSRVFGRMAESERCAAFTIRLHPIACRFSGRRACWMRS